MADFRHDFGEEIAAALRLSPRRFSTSL
ncbi:hypothetical protein ZOSMA_189G00180 [Zostera marina]|uniref:Uncharacterized protein n=1 Tax=Zostera marina TaxID=29655 RepID=A0A0K9PS62_ZOSMR|nr:hypothetical protein ZOSMA_189G00180 [Zostera marina]